MLAFRLYLSLLQCTALLYFVRPALANRYVALGDSYSADPGIGSSRKDWPSGCMQSSKNFPRRVQAKMKFKNFTDMSCSGATLENVLDGQQFGLGPQIDTLTEDTTLVTLIGGVNDIYFNLDLQRLGAHRRAHTSRPWGAMTSRFDKVLSEIHDRAPRAHVFVLNYLTLLPRNSTCSQLGLNETTLEHMFPIQENLSSIIRDVVNRHNATLIDVADESRSHTCCDETPYTSGTTGNPTPWHPTDDGVQFMADQIEKLWKNITGSDNSNGSNKAASLSTTACLLALTFLFL